MIAVVLAGLAFGLWWWFLREKPPDGITLYGNVDVRQVSLAFNANERVSEMRANEGERVKQGQVLGMLVTTTLKLHIAQAQAQSGIQEQALRRLQSGSRPQEISQARAGVAAARAEATKASQQYQRLQAISSSTNGRAVSRQDLEAASSTQAVMRAQLNSAGKALELAVASPRKEDIDQARAQLDAAKAELGVLKQQLADAELKAPIDAVVRSRLLEPGEMATPQRPAYALERLSGLLGDHVLRDGCLVCEDDGCNPRAQRQFHVAFGFHDIGAGWLQRNFHFSLFIEHRQRICDACCGKIRFIVFDVNNCAMGFGGELKPVLSSCLAGLI